MNILTIGLALIAAALLTLAALTITAARRRPHTPSIRTVHRVTDLFTDQDRGQQP